MAKKKNARATVDRSGETAAGVVAIAETKLTGFADDLGRLLGQAQNKAESWLGQRNAIVKRLTDVRDAASRLLAQLGIADAPRRGRPAKAAVVKRGPGRPPKKRRTMSAEARRRFRRRRRHGGRSRRELRPAKSVCPHSSGELGRCKSAIAPRGKRQRGVLAVRRGTEERGGGLKALDQRAGRTHRNHRCVGPSDSDGGRVGQIQRSIRPATTACTSS